jgi:hypothetical protein
MMIFSFEEGEFEKGERRFRHLLPAGQGDQIRPADRCFALHTKGGSLVLGELSIERGRRGFRHSLLAGQATMYGRRIFASPVATVGFGGHE